MSGRARIAPELEHVVAKIGAYWCGTTMPKVKEAQAQLRALLAVHAAAARAEILHQHQNAAGTNKRCAGCKLMRALARLERAAKK